MDVMARHLFVIAPGVQPTLQVGIDFYLKIKCLRDLSGGEDGIRTHGTLARTTVFETVAFNHSATSPESADYMARFLVPRKLQ